MSESVMRNECCRMNRLFVLSDEALVLVLLLWCCCSRWIAGLAIFTFFKLPPSASFMHELRRSSRTLHQHNDKPPTLCRILHCLLQASLRRADNIINYIYIQQPICSTGVDPAASCFVSFGILPLWINSQLNKAIN